METSGGNRETILDCALDLFSRRGYDAVGVQEIVALAGVTKPTLYHYFRSKQGLFAAVVASREGELLPRIQQDAEYRGNITLNLTKLMGDFFAFARGNEKFCRLMLSQYFVPGECGIHETVLAYNLKIFEPLERMFQEAAGDHGNMKGRSKAYAATFVGMVNTYIGMFLNGYIELSDELSRKALHQFMHGIFS